MPRPIVQRDRPRPIRLGLRQGNGLPVPVELRTLEARDLFLAHAGKLSHSDHLREISWGEGNHPINVNGSGRRQTAVFTDHRSVETLCWIFLDPTMGRAPAQGGRYSGKVAAPGRIGDAAPTRNVAHRAAINLVHIEIVQNIAELVERYEVAAENARFYSRVLTPLGNRFLPGVPLFAVETGDGQPPLA